MACDMLTCKPVCYFGTGYDVTVSEARRAPKERTPTVQSKKRKLDSTTTSDDLEGCTTTTSSTTEQEQQETDVMDHSYSLRTAECNLCTENLRLVQKTSQELHELKARYSVLQRKCDDKKYVSSKFINTNKNVKLNTGLPNKSTLNKLFGLLKPRAAKLRYWVGAKRTTLSKYTRHFNRTPIKSGPRRTLSVKDEFILTLMKLRLGLTTTFLADIFGISLGTCSSIFNTWVKFLARELKSLIFWPTKEQVRTYIPQKLRTKYPQLRCTIDCSETFINRPKDLKLQSCTWSDYKHHNTVKYLVAISPDGLITFLSPSFGGRTTDRYIVQNSGFLDLIEAYDLVLADRGFTIREDLMFRQAYLEIPPPSSGLDQMSTQNVLKTKKIANARIHVERAINRIKWFKILSTTLPVTLIPLFDDILIVCGALCNLLPPLVS